MSNLSDKEKEYIKNYMDSSMPEYNTLDDFGIESDDFYQSTEHMIKMHFNNQVADVVYGEQDIKI